MNRFQFFATFLVGAVFGAAVLLTITGHDLDLLYLQVSKYKQELKQTQEQKAKVEADLKQSQKKRTRRLEGWSIIVTTAPDEFSKLSIQDKVKAQLSPLVGKELTLFEQQPDLFKSLLENHTFDLPNYKVTLQVTFVVIGETTTIYVQAHAEQKTSIAPPSSS